MKEQLAISRVVGRAMLALVVLAVLGLSVAYYVVSTRLAASRLEARVAMLGAFVEQQVIRPNPEDWHVQTTRLQDRLGLQHDDDGLELRRVWLDDRLIAERGEPGAAPRLVHTVPLHAASIPVGRLEIIRSLRPLVYESLAVAPLLALAGAGFYWFLNVVPLRTLRSAERDMRERAFTDRLTGLYNRHSFQLCLQHEIARAERFQLPLALISLDVDHFKRINDTHGHAVGDRVLQALAKRLRGRVRTVDKLARWGGEELQILAPETSLKGARMLAEKVRADLEASEFPPVGQVTVSAGVTVFQPDESADDFIARADLALYHAKATGRNRVVVLAPGCHAPLTGSESIARRSAEAKAGRKLR